MSIAQPDVPDTAADVVQDEIIRIYRGWDALERVEDSAIIDFDLAAPAPARSFASRTEVLGQLEQLLESVPANLQDADFLRAKLRASVVYLRASLGELIPFADYVRKTIGVEPKYFSDELIDTLRAPLTDHLHGYKVHFKREDADLFESRFRLSDPNEVKAEIERSRETMLSRLAAFVDVPRLDRVRVDETEVDAYWANWLSAKRSEGVRLQINLHPRIRYLRGSPTMLVVHELCGHAAQAAGWADAILAGDLGKACGVTTVHGPESFASEGLAHLVTRLLIDDDADSDARFARDFVTYRNVVYNNVHYMLNLGERYRSVFDYARERLPFDRDDRVERDIRDRTVDPLMRTYQYVYGLAEQTFLKLVDASPSELRRALGFFYTRAATASQATKLVQTAIG